MRPWKPSPPVPQSADGHQIWQPRPRFPVPRRLHRWLLVDLCGHATRLDAPDADAFRSLTPALRLDQSQIDALGEALVPLTIIHQANETDSTLLSGMTKCEQVHLIRVRMLQARERGLRREDDIALYCVLSLQLPAGFDRSGPVADALHEARTRGIRFGDAIDDVPVERWREMDELLDVDAPDAGAH